MKALQINLFKTIQESIRQPLVVAYGLGVNSTAALVEMQKRNIRPDAILFADTGCEKLETYAYLPIINTWLEAVGFPQVTLVKYKPKPINGRQPYATLGEDCLSKGTLPSLAFGFKSCSLKWKVTPQNNWIKKWPMAIDYWRSGGKVRKMIGFDAGSKDLRRYSHAKDLIDAKYEHWYPLIEWGMDRAACEDSIKSVGLPVPPKSACIFCPATKPDELLDYPKEYLSTIVEMETAAITKLQGLMTAEQLEADFRNRHTIWSEKLARATGKQRIKLLSKEPVLRKLGAGCAGLWRSKTKSRPAMMTDFIEKEGLLDQHLIDCIRQSVKTLDAIDETL